MEHGIGIDVSLELSSVCVLDTAGAVVREAKLASEPEALVRLVAEQGVPVASVGLEAGPLSAWLHGGPRAAGHEVALLETRQVKAALSAMAVKTHRRDARGIARLLRMGWCRAVRRKSASSREARALLAARKRLQRTLIDLEQTVRGLLRGFGLKMGATTRGRFEGRVLTLVGGHPMLEGVMRPSLRARDALRRELAVLHERTPAIAREDEVCRRLMTVPGVGAMVSLTYRTGVDDPGRFARSKALGAYFGLTPKRHQSGEADRVGSITEADDAGMRAALHEAANVLPTRVARFSSLKRWALEVAKRRGLRRARVALARKLSVVLHRIWVDGTEFRWSKEDGAATAAA